MNKLVQKIYTFGTWLVRLVSLHILWIVFTLLGLGIFGVFPSTAAMVHVIYTWLNKGTDIKISKEFFQYYKNNFIRSNLLGIIIVFGSVLLYVDFYLYRHYINSIIFYYVFLFIGFIFILILLYLFTIMARYELSVLNIIRQSFLIAIASPFESLAMFISVVLSILLYWNIPILFFLLGPVLISFPLVWFGYSACKKVENKQEEITNEE